MPRYKITIQYNGTNYCGWQIQKNGTSIQQELTTALSQFTHESPTVVGAGRTDAGVHALGQVAHFELTREFPPYKIISAMNHFLRNKNIGITACEIVPDSFHARFSAKSRAYIYRLKVSSTPLVFHNNLAWLIDTELDSQAMQEAASYAIGTHDFSSFRSSKCQAKSPVKTLSSIEISQLGDDITISLLAPSFLHNQVRIIVGTLYQVGTKVFSPLQFQEILQAKDRTKAYFTAPACGLYLAKVEY
jgi:tRNA pseudouridine38-40 synthase